MAVEDANGSSAKIMCNKTFTLDMELHVPHGTSLVLRSVKWYVSTQAAKEPLLERPVPEAFGLTTSDILAAADDRYNGSLDLSHLCIFTVGGRIERVYVEAYHSERGADDDDWEEEEQRLDLGEDTDADWEAALQNALDDASKNGMSNGGRIEIEHLIC